MCRCFDLSWRVLDLFYINLKFCQLSKLDKTANVTNFKKWLAYVLYSYNL